MSEIWLREVDMYSTVADCVKIVIGNKFDKEAQRQVSRDEGVQFAKANGCLFLECSAKTRVCVQEAFEELVKAVLETPALLSETDPRGKIRLAAYNGNLARTCPC